MIVDEVHALADDKRGAHLALSLARLEDLVTRSGGAPPQRIGLSATVRPIEEVAAFLRSGRADAPPEDAVAIVDCGHRRRLDLAVEVPRDELGAVATNVLGKRVLQRTESYLLRVPVFRTRKAPVP